MKVLSGQLAGNREVLEYDGATGAVLRWYGYGAGPNDALNQMNVAANTRAGATPNGGATKRPCKKRST